MRMDFGAMQGAIWVGEDCETGVPIAKVSSPRPSPPAQPAPPG